jgi:hypothetical protein
MPNLFNLSDLIYRPGEPTLKKLADPDWRWRIWLNRSLGFLTMQDVHTIRALKPDVNWPTLRIATPKHPVCWTCGGQIRNHWWEAWKRHEQWCPIGRSASRRREI